jgi:mRNA-degrading endonuclease toxin of MazEF toxin-antitoxin module
VNGSNPPLTPQRGDIYWAELPPLESVGSEQHGRRPVLVVSEVVVVSVDSVNQQIPTCVVIPLSGSLTKTPRQFRIRIPQSEKIDVPGTTGCPGDSLALTEQIRVISVNRIDRRKGKVARVTPQALAAIEAGIKYVLKLA